MELANHPRTPWVTGKPLCATIRICGWPSIFAKSANDKPANGSLTYDASLCYSGLDFTPNWRLQMRQFLVLVCVFALPSALWARTNPALSSWGNLSVLQAGQKVQIIDTAQKKHSGKFSAFTDTGITLHEKHGDETIARADVLRVNVSGHRLRHTLIGMAVGTGAGAAIGAAAGGCKPGQWCFVDRPTIAAVFAGIGFVVGTIVGVLLPAHKTIYRAA